MAETTRGGFYIGRDGRAHDARGNDLGLPLSDAFPHRSVLVEEAGARTVEDVCEIEDLTAVSGIGDVTAEKICDHLADVAEDAGRRTAEPIRAALERWAPDEDPGDADDDGEDGDDNGGDEEGDDGEDGEDEGDGEEGES